MNIYDQNEFQKKKERIMLRQSSSPSARNGAHAQTTAEADHRIANSLAVIAGMVRLKAPGASSAADPSAFLLEIADRIDTVAKLHRHVAHSETDSVRLSAYLREICERLSRALARDAISFSLDCSPAIIVPFNVALPLGLMIAELFTNSLKYAHPTGLPVKISLSCRRASIDELMVVFEDDGVGFPDGFNASHDGHLGMRFVRLLSQQLGGRPHWLSDPLGVRFEITVPLRSAGRENIA